MANASVRASKRPGNLSAAANADGGPTGAASGYRGVAIMSLGESAYVGGRAFGLFGGSRPELIRTGFVPLDTAIGGVFPGTCGILGADTGIGKSSLVLRAALDSTTRVGVISTEDTADVVGTRVLAARSGVNSLDIRKGTLSPDQERAIGAARTALEGEDRVLVAYPIGGSLETILEAARGLIDKGCRLVWLDYVQKVRGVSDDRRNEVGTVYTSFQRVCYEGNAAGMVVSQFARRMDQDSTKVPKSHWLKESGDLENEARLILLAYKDKTNPAVVRVRVAKSTVGSEGLDFCYLRDYSGTLQLKQEDHDDL